MSCKCKDTDNRRLFACTHVLEGEAPLYRVIHESDGDWQALCEHGAHDSIDEAKIVCFGCFKKLKPQFEMVSNLARGTSAIALKNEPGRWWIEPLGPEEE